MQSENKTTMSKIQIQLTGVGAELVLGNYMPKDTTIFHNWEEFFHYNDLVHGSHLLADHIAEIEMKQDNALIFKGQIPASQFKAQKSASPVFVDKGLYLRTECAENAIYKCEFEVDDFDKMNLQFETQDYDMLFKVGKSFVTKMFYNDKALELEWVSAKPVGNICVLCRFENGYLVPIYDAVKRVANR